MALRLVLLLAAVWLAPGTCAPSRTSPLTFEKFAIKDDTGRVVAELDGGAGSALAAGAWTDCRREGDGLQQCWEVAGRMRRTVRAMPDFCATATSSWEHDDEGLSTSTCYPLDGVQWYGGGEEIPQKWPLNKYQSLKHSMVTQESANRGIQDPVWFSSDGDLVFVHPGTPLFVSINDPVDSPGQLCLIAEVKAPYRKRPNGFQMKTTHCKLSNAKEAYQYAIDNFLGKPSGYPDENMIRHPVWSTWARYKKAIDEPIVREFAREIKEYGFHNSQLEIDDNWETCYGSKEVNTSRFPNMKKLTDDLRADGFRVTIWTHPFIQQDCTDPLNEATSKGFLVQDEAGNVATKWWNGDGTIVDFTKPAAQDWFVNRHKAMMEANGIDGFKFDAGETSWMPQLPKLETIPPAKDEDYPNLATRMYVETCARFTGLTEVRSAYRSQALPVFVRMIDKDSRWGDNNGLKSLVTTLLQMNMVGYPLVLPDMVGGNQYNGEVATSELFIRWLQANTFMPSIQFSLVPWDYSRDKDRTVAISKNFTNLHADYTDVIVAAMKQSVAVGTPVNAPIWWLDPTDETALKEDSEFLLGESLLSAPVLEQGATKRDVYLPKGSWVDGNTCKKYAGPTTIKDYPAPLETLPWFYIEGSIADKGCGARPSPTPPPSPTPSPSPSSAASAFSSPRSLALAALSALLALLAKHSPLT